MCACVLLLIMFISYLISRVWSSRVVAVVLVIKGQRFLRIPGKSRNGTEGTEILGNPVPVTPESLTKVARFLPDHPATATACWLAAGWSARAKRAARAQERACKPGGRGEIWGVCGASFWL